MIPEGVYNVLTTTTPQSTKSSVRAKTSAFLGKMLGTSSTRERSVSTILADPDHVLKTMFRKLLRLPLALLNTQHLPFSTRFLHQCHRYRHYRSHPPSVRRSLMSSLARRLHSTCRNRFQSSSQRLTTAIPILRLKMSKTIPWWW